MIHRGEEPTFTGRLASRARSVLSDGALTPLGTNRKPWLRGDRCDRHHSPRRCGSANPAVHRLGRERTSRTGRRRALGRPPGAGPAGPPAALRPKQDGERSGDHEGEDPRLLRPRKDGNLRPLPGERRDLSPTSTEPGANPSFAQRPSSIALEAPPIARGSPSIAQRPPSIAGGKTTAVRRTSQSSRTNSPCWLPARSTAGARAVSRNQPVTSHHGHAVVRVVGRAGGVSPRFSGRPTSSPVQPRGPGPVTDRG
jgi:hypothetical protein